ncbi:MAG: efflux RND transporter permease subunit [Myxococcota bacterium]|nr:efflux RND transporter permease subunit [Myxococcota bacterium]
MSITSLALSRRTFSGVVLVGIFVYGLSLLVGYPSQENPEFTIRQAVVTTYFPGLSAAQVEDLITKQVEEEIRRIPEVEHIESSSRTGVSLIKVIVYDRYFELDNIWTDLRNRMNDLVGQLPDGSRGPFVDDDFGRVAVASIALTGHGFDYAEMRDVASDLRDQLYTTDGVSQVVIHGIQEENVFLEVNGARLSQLGVELSSIVQTLEGQNIVMPGGSIDVDGQEFVFEPTGSFASLDQIEDLVISIRGGAGVVRLGELLTVRRDYVDPQDKPAFYQGEPALVLEVAMSSGGNVVELGKRLEKEVSRFEANLPVGYQLNFATFQPKIVEVSISDFMGNLYQTVAIVLIVVVLFLGWRTGIVVGMIVPLTLLLALPFMNLLNIPFHGVSIAAMIISLGLLVDNGVVMAEEIRTRVQAGEDRYAAAISAGGALGMPLLTSSLTTILAFMPLMLAENSTGEYMRSLSQVIAITLLSSWVLALFATPVLCVWFVPEVDDKKEPESASMVGMVASYRGLVGTALRHRAIFLLGMGVLFIGGLVLFRQVPNQFMPLSERSQYMVFLDLAAGTHVEHTRDEALRLATWLRDTEENPDVEDHIIYVGYGGPRFVLNFAPSDPAPHRAFVLVNTVAGADVGRQIERTRNYLDAGFPDVRARVQRLSQGTSEVGAVDIRVSGPDREVLVALADQASEAMAAVPGIANLRDDWENRVGRVIVDVDQYQARLAKVSSQETAGSLQLLFSGVNVSEFREGDLSLPIVARSDKSGRHRLDQVATTDIYSAARGASVPLLQIADFDVVWELGEVSRRDMTRTVTISANHPRLSADELVAAILPALEALELSEGYSIEVGGEVENSAKARAALFASVPTCGLLIVLLLVFQFNSLRKPLTIMLTIPLSLIGAALGLWITGASFGFAPLLGLLSLAGIIINNAIVLIDRIETQTLAGLTEHDAIIEAAAQRLRPILMTTLTTILGLMPLMFFGGSLWFGMSVVIAFGLGVGTLLTLGVVPVLYATLFRIATPPPT